MITAEKAKVISDFATGKGDTGSPEVQIAILLKNKYFNRTFQEHHKDNHGRRGLLKMVAQRKTFTILKVRKRRVIKL